MIFNNFVNNIKLSDFFRIQMDMEVIKKLCRKVRPERSYRLRKRSDIWDVDILNHGLENEDTNNN